MAGVVPINTTAKKRKNLYWQARLEEGNMNAIKETAITLWQER